MTTATSDTGTAFRLPAEDLAFIRAVSQRTGIPQSDIFREGGKAYAVKVATSRGVLTEVERDAERGSLPPPVKKGRKAGS